MTLNNIMVFIINAMAHAICFSALLYNVSIIITKKKFNAVLLAGILFIAALMISFVSEAYILIVIFLASFIFMMRCGISKGQSILTCVVTIAICFLNFLALFIIFNTIQLSVESVPNFRLSIVYNFSMSVVYMILSFVDILFIRLINKKINYVNQENSINIWSGFVYIVIGGILFLLGITAAFSLFTTVIGMNSIREYLISCDILMLIQFAFSVIVAVIILFSAIILYTSYKFAKQKKREFEIEKDKEIAELYKTEIQNMYDEISDFKHDYMKIYSSMSILIANNKIEELKRYFSDEITPLQEQLLSETSTTHNLTLIEDSIIQGLVYTYALKARNININFYVALDKDIPQNTKISSLEVSRMIGILLDNAFEEVASQSDGMVQLSISRGPDETIYTVKNTCDKKINVQEILSGRFSSKGDGRGRGLKILRSACDKYKSVLFNINYDERWFVAEIVIVD